MLNLVSKIEECLPAELIDFMRDASAIAAKRRQNLYLVGGVVRDLLLGKTTLDLDLVMEGDAIDLAQQLSPLYPGKLTTHPPFGTAKLQWRKWSADLATARSETYCKPGALPDVTPGSIENDLFRRDFTINAMAVNLSPDKYGELIDRHGGRDDLGHKQVRVLHDRSFIDDATRIWRGLRYEQRLNFRLEIKTLKLLRRDISMLDTISGDRIRYELECVLNEESPEKALRRADELGVLTSLLPSLKDDSWLAEKFRQARQLYRPNSPPLVLYMALLAYPLTDEKTTELISCLKLPKSTAKTLRDTINLKNKFDLLADPEITPGGIYSRLHNSSITAITANELASDSAVVRQHIHLFKDKLRYVKPILTGNDLNNMGITGPRTKEILNRLLAARLDGKVSSKEDEKGLVSGWLAGY